MNDTTNLFDYLIWRGDLSFSDSPFCEIDGMILARLAYIPFELYFNQEGRQSHKLQNICQYLLSLPDIKSHLLEEQDDRLLLALSKSNRFCHIRVYDYVNIFDVNKQAQFCACTLKLYDGSFVIAYRGTDSTIVGWKEDFNMGYLCPLPSQTHAVKYLNIAYSRYPGSLILTGHSKGGNIAVYAGIFCKPEVQNSIKSIYAYDSPGFPESVLTSPEYKRIVKKIFSFVPQGSMVGTLLGHKEKYQIIHSSAAKMREQHFMYSWDVVGTKLVYEAERTDGSLIFENTMHQWVKSLNPTEYANFVDAMYALFSDVDAVTLSEIKAKWFANSKTILSSYREMDDEHRKEISNGISAFFKSAKDEILSGARSKLKSNKTAKEQ